MNQLFYGEMKTITLFAALAIALAGCATTEQQEKLAFETYAQYLRSGLMERMEKTTGKTWKDWTVEQRALVNSLYLQGLKNYIDKQNRDLAAYNATRPSAPIPPTHTTPTLMPTPNAYGGTTTFTRNPVTGSGTISFPDGTHASVTTNPITGTVSIQQY